MGVDYIARKAAKKRNKRAHKDDHKGDHNARKERAARGVPKKRQGVCWGQPVLMDEDKFESEEEAGDPSQYDVLCGAGLEDPKLRPEMLQSNREKRLKATVPFNKNNNFELLRPAAPPKDADDPSATAKKPAKKDKKALKLSTAVAPLPSSKEDVKEKEASAAAERGTDANVHDPEGQNAGQTPALAGLHPVMQAYLVQNGFSEPTEVQRRVWPVACSGCDVVAQAPTGSGKTLAFVLPMAVRLVEAGHGRDTRPAGPAALAVEPTRELALQTARAFAPLKRAAGLRAACVYGGADRAEQVALLQHLPHALVATPGRLLDLYDTGALRLSLVRCVALDECDKMLGLGFAPQLDRLADLLLHTPPSAPENGGTSGAPDPAPHADIPRKKRRRDVADRTTLVPISDPAAQALPADADGGGGPQRPQVLLLSATGAADGEEGEGGAGQVPEAMARWVAADAERVCVAGLTGASISETITQVVQVCAEHKKLAKLLKHLQSVHAAQEGARQLPRVIIFANRIKTVAYLHKELKAAGFKAEALHGQRGQAEREAALKGFRAGKVQVLVATDVAARGLHVRQLPYIVNYDFPGNLETYIHRVGRTGRLKAHGHAFSFFTRNLARLAPATVKLLADCGQALDPNLVKLRDAFNVVVAKLGPEKAAALMRGAPADGPPGSGAADETAAPGDEGEGEGEMGGVDYPDDLREGVQVLLQGKKANKRQKKPASEGAGAGELSGQSLPAFIPSARFTGRRPGFIFSTRKPGTGYYPDTTAPSQPSAKRKRKSQHGHAGDAEPPAAQAAARSAAAPAAAAEAAKQQQRSKRAGILGPPKTALLAGDLGGSDSDMGGSSDDEPPRRRKVSSGATDATGKGAAKAKKALPGRLRKKLAREKAAA